LSLRRRSGPSPSVCPDGGILVDELARLTSEQAAVRRIATLVARGVAPAELFSAVAQEVAALLDGDGALVARLEPDGVATILAASGARAGEFATPIIVEGDLWGVIVVSSRRESLPADSEQRMLNFTHLVATAIAIADSRSALTASRARIVAASDETRRRVERDLHDGVQQRLVSLRRLGAGHEHGQARAGVERQRRRHLSRRGPAHRRAR
jgi:signal transduction histidine kinase